MKKTGLVLLMVPFLMLSSCVSVSIFKKPSFKKYSNEVSFEEFSSSFIENYKANSLLGENGEIKKSLSYNGYSYGNAERVIKNKNNKTMHDVSVTVSNKTQVQYDSKRGIGNSDLENHRSESDASFKTSTVKNNKESKIKTQYVKTDSGKGVIGVYQKPKIYIIYSDTDKMTVTKYLKNSIESTFTFGESFLPNYSVLSDEAKSNYHFYIDKNVYTIYFHEQVKYSYKTSVNEVETEYASSLIQNTEKRQFVLSDKPIYASIRTTKETTQFTADYGDRAKGDTEIYNFNNYIKSQVSFQYVNIKPISYKNFDCVTQLPVID